MLGMIGSEGVVAMPAKTIRSRRRTRGFHAGRLDISQRIGRVIDALGSNQTAAILGVSRSQPSRWRSGHERPSGAHVKAVTDLDYVMARLLQTFPPEVARVWLSSVNAHLGARPIDVLHLRGPLPVIAAIDAEDAGAYA